VFAVYTKTQERLKEVLEQAGFKAALLTSKVPPARREAWYMQRVREGVQVVLAHPKLVETGLDLLDFPTIYFYETGHSLHVLRQASRRSYRIGQKLPVRVKFLCYQDTSQDICLSLMARKLMVALTTEGQFSGEGLQEFESAEDDMLSALARELVNKDGIGETAEQAWRALRDTQEALRVGSAEVEPDILEDDDEGIENNQLPAGELVSVLETGENEAAAGQRSIFGQKPDSFIRKRSARTPSGQGSLFDGI